jgi:hypothetical protein
LCIGGDVKTACTRVREAVLQRIPRMSGKMDWVHLHSNLAGSTPAHAMQHVFGFHLDYF